MQKNITEMHNQILQLYSNIGHAADELGASIKPDTKEYILFWQLFMLIENMGSVIYKLSEEIKNDE